MLWCRYDPTKVKKERRVILLTTLEDNLLFKIKELESEQLEARAKISKAKKEISEAESDLIEHTLHKEKLIEQLRLLRNQTVDTTLSAEDIDLERFKLVHPELSKKIT